MILLLFVLLIVIYLQHQKIKKMDNAAERDPLTGAYNRDGFIKLVESFLAAHDQANSLCILFFNIKGFKAINELFGVEAGDAVLRQSVELLQNSTLKPIYIARFEADHFVCLLDRSTLDFDALVRICHRTFVDKDKQFHFYGRCGVYIIADPSIGVSGMCDRAKLAKESIVDDYAKPYAVYNGGMRDGFVTKKEMTSELQRALSNKEFKVYYQPIYDVKTGSIVSAEALVRWEHPVKGLISPGLFIPTFEENGYISELDLYVGDQSTAFLSQRVAANQFVVPIAVNLSRMDFYNPKLMEKLLRDIREAKLPVGYQRIEITESAYASLAEYNSEILSKIKKLGIPILLDDFGSGYSSFSSVRDFDFDVIKLDIGFTHQIGVSQKSEWIIHSIIEMTHHLGAKVIAEGVESQLQADFLLKADCDYIQGFFYSKPLAQRDFEALLDRCQQRPLHS